MVNDCKHQQPVDIAILWDYFMEIMKKISLISHHQWGLIIIYLAIRVSDNGVTSSLCEFLSHIFTEVFLSGGFD